MSLSLFKLRVAVDGMILQLKRDMHYVRIILI